VGVWSGLMALFPFFGWMKPGGLRGVSAGIFAPM